MTIPAQTQSRPSRRIDRSVGRQAGRPSGQQRRARFTPRPVADPAVRFGYRLWAGRIGWLIALGYALAVITWAAMRYSQ